MSALEYEPDDDRSEGWHIEDDAGADWALRKLAAAEAEQARLRQRHADEVAILDARLAETLAQPCRDADFFRAHLVDYHRRVSPEGKRIRLMHGDLTSRAGSRVVVVEDEELLLTFLEAEGLEDCVRVKRSPSLSALKTLMDAKGWTDLPGASLVEKERTWTPVVERPT